MKTSGIYQIVNLTNNKSYIGLSIDISNRWKQHTQHVQDDEVPTSRIRAALKKYGLNETVYRPGQYGAFEFKIIEECEEQNLFEKEKYWIDKIQPEYNCDIMTLPKFYRANHKRKYKKSWIQYHNFEKENGYPANDVLKRGNAKVYDAYHYISSKKRSLLYSQGDTIYIIVGIGKRTKFYYLWSQMLVEEVDFIEEEDLIYNAFGDQLYLNPPQLLNKLSGFSDFRKSCGNFGFGFFNITQNDFAKILEDIAQKKALLDDSISFKSFIQEFEKQHAKIL